MHPETPNPHHQTHTENEEQTHFGYRQVATHEKTRLVSEVFHSVARQYDLMNDLMSFGIHRLWKQYTIQLSQVKRGHIVLDLAGGTGDLAKHFAKRVGENGKVVLADINASMLAVGRERLLNRGFFNNVFYTQANAESLPFSDDYFDCITIAFGLRNVTHKDKALSEMCRVLKPGGQLFILEFSKPTTSFLSKIYDAYSFNILPKLGELIVKDAESYQYLVESIRQHPDQTTLREMILNAGFDDCQFHNLTGGIVALHRGFKY